MVHICDGILLSHEKELKPFAATWMEIIILSEVSQTKKDKYHMIWLICGILKKKGTNELTHKTEIKLQI